MQQQSRDRDSTRDAKKIIEFIQGRTQAQDERDLKGHLPRLSANEKLETSCCFPNDPKISNRERRQLWKQARRKEIEANQVPYAQRHEVRKSLGLPSTASDIVLQREVALTKQVQYLERNLDDLIKTAITRGQEKIFKIRIDGPGFGYQEYFKDYDMAYSATLILPIYAIFRGIDWYREKTSKEEFYSPSMKRFNMPVLSSAQSPALDRLRSLAKREGLDLHFLAKDPEGPPPDKYYHLRCIEVRLPKEVTEG